MHIGLRLVTVLITIENVLFCLFFRGTQIIFLMKKRSPKQRTYTLLHVLQWHYFTFLQNGG